MTLLENDLNPPVEREPAWTYWDISLVAAVFIASLLVTATVGLGFAHFIPYFQGMELQRIQANPLFWAPVQFLAYLLTFFVVRMVITSRSRTNFWAALHWNMPNLSSVGQYALGGVALAFFVLLGQRFLPIPKALPIEQYFRAPVFAYTMLAFGLLVAPLAEEIFFRGLLFPLLKRTLGAVAGTALTALSFALLHQGQLARAWAPLLLLFCVGLAITIVRARANSVAAGWIVHFCYNATLFAMLYYGTGGFRHLERIAE